MFENGVVFTCNLIFFSLLQVLWLIFYCYSLGTCLASKKVVKAPAKSARRRDNGRTGPLAADALNRKLRNESETFHWLILQSLLRSQSKYTTSNPNSAKKTPCFLETVVFLNHSRNTPFLVRIQNSFLDEKKIMKSTIRII